MSWRVFRWVWRLESPLHIGASPAGAINRCRLYAPARVFWGAVTAETARMTAAGFPDYQTVGQTFCDRARLTYLYPAQQVGDQWRAWLPQYEKGEGLVWRCEGDTQTVPDRDFRRRILGAYPATAIDPSSDTAADGSLRETECINPTWRDAQGRAAGGVGLAGYVFLDQSFPYKLDALERLWVGGDTRYGLGRLRRLIFEEATSVFGASVITNSLHPQIQATRVLAHAEARSRDLIGQYEMIGGWGQQGSQYTLWQAAQPLWVPGSCFEDAKTQVICWAVLPPHHLWVQS